MSYKKGDRVESNRRDPFYIKCRALHKLLVTCEFQYLVAVVDDSHSVGNEDDGLLFVEHGPDFDTYSCHKLLSTDF